MNINKSAKRLLASIFACAMLGGIGYASSNNVHAFSDTARLTPQEIQTYNKYYNSDYNQDYKDNKEGIASTEGISRISDANVHLSRKDFNLWKEDGAYDTTIGDMYDQKDEQGYERLLKTKGANYAIFHSPNNADNWSGHISDAEVLWNLAHSSNSDISGSKGQDIYGINDSNKLSTKAFIKKVRRGDYLKPYLPYLPPHFASYNKSFPGFRSNHKLDSYIAKYEARRFSKNAKMNNHKISKKHYRKHPSKNRNRKSPKYVKRGEYRSGQKDASKLLNSLEIAGKTTPLNRKDALNHQYMKGFYNALRTGGSSDMKGISKRYASRLIKSLRTRSLSHNKIFNHGWNDYMNFYSITKNGYVNPHYKRNKTYRNGWITGDQLFNSSYTYKGAMRNYYKATTHNI